MGPRTETIDTITHSASYRREYMTVSSGSPSASSGLRIGARSRDCSPPDSSRLMISS